MDLKPVQILENKGEIVKLEKVNNGSVVLGSKRKRESNMGESSKSGSSIDRKSCNGNLLVNNYKNLQKSGLPQRVLFHQNNQWIDFPLDIIGLVRENFQMKRSLIEVQIHNHPSILDFFHMIEIDLKTGLEKPIAWIDEAGGCFFPQLDSICNRSCTFHLSKSHRHQHQDVEESNTGIKKVKNGIEMNTRDQAVKAAGSTNIVYRGNEGRVQHKIGNNRFREESNTRIPFTSLIEAISDKINAKDMSLVKMHYEFYKINKISKLEFVKELKLLVGDKLLLSSLTSNQLKRT
ncbi:inactive poly [ADP-ribose] polymerase RCD1-like [Impatiens glandulifera]|uniref:inactive poly [ADP-ribose] polymerase RCD1-like n=1 Tax=Impatiens glandulifera TaxID=253017 RepID=UPI001FB17421|nr:inactive poly [ADP-ribose] polymerase RCD1-like [Impatiens glandulifera]